MVAKKKKITIQTDTEAPVEENDATPTDDADEDVTAAGDSDQELEAKLESAEQEARDSHDRFLRVSAEFENYKKRAAREMDDFRKFANESFARGMLSVVDNLDRAIESSTSDKHVNSSLLEGVDMTIKEILKVFDQFGVKPIESLGEQFDPGFHQAVMQEENEDHPDNTVIKELQKGYMIHDRLLRPAMVVVSKAKEPDEQGDGEEEKQNTKAGIRQKAVK